MVCMCIALFLLAFKLFYKQTDSSIHSWPFSLYTLLHCLNDIVQTYISLTSAPPWRYMAGQTVRSFSLLPYLSNPYSELYFSSRVSVLLSPFSLYMYRRRYLSAITGRSFYSIWLFLMCRLFPALMHGQHIYMCTHTHLTCRGKRKRPG